MPMVDPILMVDPIPMVEPIHMVDPLLMLVFNSVVEPIPLNTKQHPHCAISMVH